MDFLKQFTQAYKSLYTPYFNSNVVRRFQNILDEQKTGIQIISFSSVDDNEYKFVCRQENVRYSVVIKNKVPSLSFFKE